MTGLDLKSVEVQPSVDVLDELRRMLVLIKLTTYAADAMRVLNLLQQQADQSHSFNQSMKSVCVDWRNPGSLDDPADLITETLMQVSASMVRLLSNGGVSQDSISAQGTRRSSIAFAPCPSACPSPGISQAP